MDVLVKRVRNQVSFKLCHLVVILYVHPPPLNADVYNVELTNRYKIWYHQIFNVNWGGLEDEDSHGFKSLILSSLVNNALEMMNNIMGIFVCQMYNIIWKPKTTNWICGNMIVVFCDFQNVISFLSTSLCFVNNYSKLGTFFST